MYGKSNEKKILHFKEIFNNLKKKLNIFPGLKTPPIACN